ncbi:MAG: hypothetical protein WD872_06715, partial [Pirellulaceae bacterium]
PPTALPMLLRAFSLGAPWSQRLIDDPEAFDRLRATGGQPLSRAALAGDIGAEIAALADERSLIAALGRLKQRETLRIAYGEVVQRHKVELVAEQLTWLAEALIAAALAAALQKVAEQRSLQAAPAQPPRIAVVALGRLGGAEMDYGERLDLLMFYRPSTGTEAAHRAEHEGVDRLARLLSKYLGDANSADPLYRIHLVTLPDSQSPQPIHTAEDVVLGFDTFGRTWHRQALLKARPIAGDAALAREVLARLEPWVYRRYLSRADETGIKSLQRRLLRQRASTDDAQCDIAASRGGLNDIEGTVQFLQLLFGGDHAGVRQRGTLAAIAELELAGLLSVPERTLLEESYVWLRQVEHRLQIAFGPGITAVPAESAALAQIAHSLKNGADRTDLVAAARSRLAAVWVALSRILAAAVTDQPPPEVVDLLLDPAPSEHEAAAALTGYGFSDPQAAARGLADLATERVPFLSTRRCRHFLSLIAERLLSAIAITPDPDRTLSSLCRVSDSLGAKGVLWELLEAHAPSLQLVVRLCAASPYLAGIVTTNPGTIDDLVDSLQQDRLPTRSELERSLVELSRGATDTLPILHDLKNASHLRIGVRDILGKDSIEATHQALADVAEFCLAHLAQREYERLVEKHGPPTLGPGAFEGEPCHLVILALGKLAGREPNYHSNVEVAFLYEAEGTTRPAARTRQVRTTNNHFFTQLAQRVLKESSELTPQGRLATIDVALRPLGVGGALALPLADFAQHFLSVAVPLWQWQALCKARPVWGEGLASAAVENVLRQLLTARTWSDGDRAEIYRARLDSQRGAAELNLKRASGGTLDIESLVQMLQLRHARQTPAVLVPGTQDALAALAAAGHLSRDDAEYLAESYRFLRRIESCLRLLNASARHDLPEDPLELSKLALLLGQPNAETIRDRSIITLAENRRRFERIVGPQRGRESLAKDERP